MKILNVFLLLLIPTLLFFSCDDPPKDNQKSDDLVEQLGARKYNEREAAEKELCEMGEDALPALLKRVDDEDLEIKQRVNRIIRKILDQIARKDEAEREKAMNKFIEIDKEKTLKLLKKIALDESEESDALRSRAALEVYRHDPDEAMKIFLPPLLDDPDNNGPLVFPFLEEKADKQLRDVLFDKNEKDDRRATAAQILALRSTKAGFDILLDGLLDIQGPGIKLPVDDKGKMIILGILQSSMHDLLAQRQQDGNQEEAHNKIQQIIRGLEKFLETKPAADLADKAKSIIKQGKS